MTPAQIRDKSQKRFTERLFEYQVPLLFSRLADTTDIKQRQVGLKTAHLPRQPGDFLVQLSGEPLFIAEVKGTVDPKTFRFYSAFEEMQKEWIHGLALLNPKGYHVFICQFIYSDSSRSERWFKLDAAQTSQLISRRKAIPFDQMDSYTWNPFPNTSRLPTGC